MAAAQPALAQAIPVPSDPRARYEALEIAPRRGGLVEVLTRRDGPSGTSYAVREVDCRGDRFRYVGEGDTLAEAKRGTESNRLAPLVGGLDLLARGAIRVPVGRALSGPPGRMPRVASWLRDARVTGGTLAVCVAALAVAGCLRSEPALRWVGLALQLSGVGTVAYGIRETRSLFGQPGWHQRLRAWWARRPKRKLGSTGVGMAGVGMAGVAAAAASGSGRLTATAGPDAALEQRVRALEQNLGSLERWFGEAHGRLSQGLQEASARLDAETRTRAHETSASDRLLRAAQVGGLDISAMGLVWLAPALGLLLATGSVEIARGMGWLPPDT